jgi:hypothetical protein
MGKTGGVTVSDITFLITALSNRAAGYQKSQQYYDGDHRPIVATDMYQSVFGTYLKTFTYNRCRTIVDAHTDRLKIMGFADEAGREEIADRAAEIWNRNRMDRYQIEIETEALVLGAAFAIVWPDENNFPRIYPQRGDRMMIRWSDDDPRKIAVAAKIWMPIAVDSEKPKWHLNLYYPDRLEKYIAVQSGDHLSTKPAGWEPREDDGDAGIWPVRYPWGEGIPVFPFLNRARLGGWGISELADIIPLQNMINKSLVDMAVAGEFTSFPQRWVVGAEPNYDAETGQLVNPFESGPNKLWMVPGDADGATPSFGQFEPGDITQYTHQQESLDKQMARVSAVPAHYLGMSGDFPSGESLKTAEAPFTRKIEKLQTARGNDWIDLMHFALGLTGLELKDVELEAIWEPAEPRSDIDFWNTATLKLNAGVPEEQVWEEAGYTVEQIAEWKAAAKQREEEMARQMQRRLNDQPPDDEEDDAGADPAVPPQAS